MRRALDVVGAHVMDVESGKEVGVVEDLLFDREGRLQGVLLEKRHWFEHPPFLPISHIKAIGEDWITTSGTLEHEADYECPEDWFRFEKGDQHIVGLPVVTTNGKQLGILEDVYFQEDMGNIVGYEVSDGFFADVMEGRQMIEPPQKLMFGKDAFVISEMDEDTHARMDDDEYFEINNEES